MAYRIITISRQYGAGGRDVSRAVSDLLNIHLYDHDLSARIAEETGLPLDYVESKGEYAAGRSFSSFIDRRNGSGRSPQDEIWDSEQRLIRELAAQGDPCLFLGRSADYILRDESDCLHVFLYADPSIRARRAAAERGLQVPDPVKYIMDRDKRRSMHCEFYTGRIWGLPENYQLMLNTGKLGTAACAALIAAAYRA